MKIDIIFVIFCFGLALFAFLQGCEFSNLKLMGLHGFKGEDRVRQGSGGGEGVSVAKGELPITDEPRILYKNIARGLKKSLSAKKKLPCFSRYKIYLF